MVAAGQQRGGLKGEARLALELTCMSNLLSTSEERVYFKDRLSRFLLVSEGWIAAYAPGRTADELIGKTDFDVFSEPHASAAFADEQTIIRTGEPVVGKVELETFAGRPDAWVSTTKMPLRDSGGGIIGTFGISRDVTAQINAENMKDDFIAMVSHELRTPLTSIIGYVTLLRDERTGARDATAYTEVIHQNSQRLLRLVEDLLFLSQTRAEKMAVHLRSADLMQITASVVAEMRPEAERRNIGLFLHATAVRHPSADGTRIAQLLRNLMSNALKFTAPGGKVDVSLGAEGGQAVIAVADTGIGICPADREQIFERFFRSAAATRQMIPGTGLGLTIARYIVAAHNGTITVESEESRGSTFTVRLPLQLP